MKTENIRFNMDTSPGSRKHLMDSDESLDHSRESHDAPGQTSMGRSGRIRKAKVVFDPSDIDAFGMKRKSWAAMESEVKPKKIPRSSDVKKDHETSDSGSWTILPMPIKEKTVTATVTAPATAPTTETAAAKKVTQRRKTVATINMNENNEIGCIVCKRTDIKKGRFVICIDCPSRGHFTCLRNAKYLSLPPEEKRWQCRQCQRCHHCNDRKRTEPLYKCTACYLSFHVACMTKTVGVVTKKKFKCDNCLSTVPSPPSHDTTSKAKDAAPSKSDIKLVKETPGNGFAGFSQEETTKIPSDGATVKKAVAPLSREKSEYVRKFQEKLKKSVQFQRKTAELNATSLLAASDSRIKPSTIKVEPKDRTPSPDVTPFVNPPNSTAAMDTSDPIVDDANDNIQYDEMSRMRPHESIPDVKRWDCDEVYTYFMARTSAEYADLFRENQIDGDALLLIRREDVLNRFNLKLGPALRLYSHIVTLQYKNNNPILAWQED